MGVVHHAVDALDVVLFDVVGIDRSRPHIALCCILVASHAYVNVRGHVHQVSRPGHQLGKPISQGDGPLGLRGGLNGMDVVVNSPGVIGIALQDRLQRGDDFKRARLGLAAVRPQVPGTQVHERFGEKRGSVKVVRVAS